MVGNGSLSLVIDLRSDTVTQPTPGMRRAIAEAVVGDEQKREDPTVIELERRVVSLENTHNNAGGRVWPLDELDEVVATARELGLGVHLDGARLLNAATALDCPPDEIASRADTVTLCLSKGLGCPLGALLASSTARIEQARREKHLFGGAMRQAGIVAAAGLYALEHHVERLAEDHDRARRLAQGLEAAGVPVDLEQVETNFVQIDLAPLAPSPDEALARLRERGV